MRLINLFLFAASEAQNSNSFVVVSWGPKMSWIESLFVFGFMFAAHKCLSSLRSSNWWPWHWSTTFFYQYCSEKNSGIVAQCRITVGESSQSKQLLCSHRRVGGQSKRLIMRTKLFGIGENCLSWEKSLPRNFAHATNKFFFFIILHETPKHWSSRDYWNALFSQSKVGVENNNSLKWIYVLRIVERCWSRPNNIWHHASVHSV